MKNLGFDTIATHGGYEIDPTTRSIQVPLYMTSAYSFENTEAARSLFALESAGNIYSRIGNPTTDVFEKRITQLEGGVGALATSSGHAAMVMTFLALAGNGGEIVSSRSIYGGAVNMMKNTLSLMGIKVHFVDSDHPEEFEKATNEKTRAYFLETMGNPFSDVPDIEAIAAIAHKHGIPLIADNTVATPYLMQPFTLGADIVVHSVSKYIAGNGDIIMGVVIDSGKFAWKNNPRFSDFNTPDDSYHGIVYADIGEAAFITKLRTHLMRDIGTCPSPFNSWLGLLGLETLSLRMERHSQNALRVAEFLEAHDKVESVSYCGLKSSPNYALAKKYAPKGQSSMFTFDLKGGKDAGTIFCDCLKLIPIVTNIGDSRTLVNCPAATTHSQLSPEQLREIGITAGTIRISVGIESIEDIIADIEQALSRV